MPKRTRKTKKESTVWKKTAGIWTAFLGLWRDELTSAMTLCTPKFWARQKMFWCFSNNATCSGISCSTLPSENLSIMPKLSRCSHTEFLKKPYSYWPLLPPGAPKTFFSALEHFGLFWGFHSIALKKIFHNSLFLFNSFLAMYLFVYSNLFEPPFYLFKTL